MNGPRLVTAMLTTVFIVLFAIALSCSGGGGGDDPTDDGDDDDHTGDDDDSGDDDAGDDDDTGDDDDSTEPRLTIQSIDPANGPPGSLVVIDFDGEVGEDESVYAQFGETWAVFSLFEDGTGQAMVPMVEDDLPDQTTIHLCIDEDCSYGYSFRIDPMPDLTEEPGTLAGEALDFHTRTITDIEVLADELSESGTFDEANRPALNEQLDLYGALRDVSASVLADMTEEEKTLLDQWLLVSGLSDFYAVPEASGKDNDPMCGDEDFAQFDKLIGMDETSAFIGNRVGVPWSLSIGIAIFCPKCATFLMVDALTDHLKKGIIDAFFPTDLVSVSFHWNSTYMGGTPLCPDGEEPYVMLGSFTTQGASGGTIQGIIEIAIAEFLKKKVPDPIVQVLQDQVVDAVARKLAAIGRGVYDLLVKEVDPTDAEDIIVRFSHYETGHTDWGTRVRWYDPIKVVQYLLRRSDPEEFTAWEFTPTDPELAFRTETCKVEFASVPVQDEVYEIDMTLHFFRFGKVFENDPDMQERLCIDAWETFLYDVPGTSYDPLETTEDIDFTAWCCRIDELSRDAEEENPALTCEECDPETSRSEWTWRNNCCWIDGEEWVDGNENPDLGCEECDFSESRTAWTWVDDCCWIDGQAWDDGDQNPSNECEFCDDAFGDAE